MSDLASTTAKADAIPADELGRINSALSHVRVYHPGRTDEVFDGLAAALLALASGRIAYGTGTASRALRDAREKAERACDCEAG